MRLEELRSGYSLKKKKKKKRFIYKRKKLKFKINNNFLKNMNSCDFVTVPFDLDSKRNCYKITTSEAYY